MSALQQACPELGAEDVLDVLAVQTPDMPGTVIPMLVNKLMGMPVQIVLMLDDYHVTAAAMSRSPHCCVISAGAGLGRAFLRDSPRLGEPLGGAPARTLGYAIIKR